MTWDKDGLQGYIETICKLNDWKPKKKKKNHKVKNENK